MTKAQALHAAEQLIEANEEIGNWKSIKEEAEAQLRVYVEQTGAEEIGDLLVYERASAVKLESTKPTVTAKKATQKFEILMEDEEDYWKKSLNLKAIHETPSDEVEELLEKCHLKTVRPSAVYFKKN